MKRKPTQTNFLTDHPRNRNRNVFGSFYLVWNSDVCCRLRTKTVGLPTESDPYVIVIFTGSRSCTSRHVCMYVDYISCYAKRGRLKERDVHSLIFFFTKYLDNV